jgi:hypothetical protein
VELRISTIKEVFDVNLSGTTKAVSQNKSRINFYGDQIRASLVFPKETLWQWRTTCMLRSMLSWRIVVNCN